MISIFDFHLCQYLQQPNQLLSIALFLTIYSQCHCANSSLHPCFRWTAGLDMFIYSWINEALHCGYLFKIKIWWYWWPFGDFSAPEKFSYQSILALNYFSIFISSCILLQIVYLAIQICLNSLLLPTHINAWAFAALLSCSVIDKVECFSHQSNSSSFKNQFWYQFLQKAHSSIIFPYTDYVATSLIHDVTRFYICR